MWRFHKEAKEKEKEPTEASGKILEHESANAGVPRMGVMSPQLPIPNHLQPPVAVDNPWIAFIILVFFPILRF